MTLIQSWIDSLQLLKPKNLHLFALVTLKSIIEAYKLMFKYFWWVIVLLVFCFVAPYFFPHVHTAELADTIFGITRLTFNHFARHIAFFLSCWLYELLFLAVCFSTRPSVTQKNCDYFRTQFKKIILYWLFVPLFSWSSASYYGYIFTVLFFADSEGGPKNFLLSIWNAIKMVVYNLPLVVPVGMVVYLTGWAGGQLIGQILTSDSIAIYPQFFLSLNLAGALLLPLGVCTFANIYIKKLHDQFDLYFKPAQ